MNDRKNQIESEEYEKFLEELQNEWNYHNEGGTPYRKETTKLALQVANQVREYRPFLNRETSLELVSKSLQGFDLYRINDVGKMLNVIARDIELNANMSEELKEKLKQKRLNRKRISFS